MSAMWKEVDNQAMSVERVGEEETVSRYHRALSDMQLLSAEGQAINMFFMG